MQDSSIATELYYMSDHLPVLLTLNYFLEVGIDENHGQWGYCRLPWIDQK